jgi:hypothetical protein
MTSERFATWQMSGRQDCLQLVVGPQMSLHFLFSLGEGQGFPSTHCIQRARRTRPIATSGMGNASEDEEMVDHEVAAEVEPEAEAKAEVKAEDRDEDDRRGKPRDASRSPAKRSRSRSRDRRSRSRSPRREVGTFATHSYACQ